MLPERVTVNVNGVLPVLPSALLALVAAIVTLDPTGGGVLPPDPILLAEKSLNPKFVQLVSTSS